MQFVDLKKIYQTREKEIDTAIQDVISQTAFIGSDNNPFIVAFEKEFGEEWIITFAPSFKDSLTISRPIPEVAPVTITTLFSNVIFNSTFVLFI